jgi:HSP20 family protein
MRRLTEDLDRAFSGLGGVSRRGGSEEDFSWIPSVEVAQSGNNLIIRADLPGLSEHDVTIEATEEGLILQGERKREETKEEGGVYRSERVYGRFYRLIPLLENAKIDQAQANFRNGVLEVTVPVPELERKRRQIPVSTSGQSGQAGQTGQSRSASTSR